MSTKKIEWYVHVAYIYLGNNVFDEDDQKKPNDEVAVCCFVGDSHVMRGYVLRSKHYMT